MKSTLTLLLSVSVTSTTAFSSAPPMIFRTSCFSQQYAKMNDRKLGDNNKIMISNKRRQQLGIPDGEDEYDLDKALEMNTDPLISKIISGSLIVAILVLLVVGVIVPSLTDYGEGVCSPIQSGGRC